MKFVTVLSLGRVSNLPTIGSNVLAGVALAGVDHLSFNIMIIVLAMVLIYMSGMFFNDIFDVKYDAEFNPSRPIVSNRVSLTEAIFWACFMMLVAMGLIIFQALNMAESNHLIVYAGLILCVCVLLYDVWHKNNPFSALIMGMCRALVYVTAAFSIAPVISMALIVYSTCLLSWVLGLTMIAKKQQVVIGYVVLIGVVNGVLLFGLSDVLGGMVSIVVSVMAAAVLYWFVFGVKGNKYCNTVTLLIASISLLDAMIIVASTGGMNLMAMMAMGLFFLTLFLQRLIVGS